MGNGKTSLSDYEWHALTDADAQQHQQFVRAWSIHFNTPYYYSPTLSRNRSSSNFSAPGSFTPPTQLWKSHSVNRTRMTLKSVFLLHTNEQDFHPEERDETRERQELSLLQILSNCKLPPTSSSALAKLSNPVDGNPRKFMPAKRAREFVSFRMGNSSKGECFPIMLIISSPE